MEKRKEKRMYEEEYVVEGGTHTLQGGTMLMREEKPYEEGSILMDAPKHDMMWELAELARKNDKKLWRLEANMIACKQNSIPARVTRRRTRAMREGG